MFEVEAKVWVKDKLLWEKILEKVKKIADFKKDALKEDFYLAKKGEQKTVCRLRIYDGVKNEVCVKQKTIQNGIEQNEEEIFDATDLDIFWRDATNSGLEVFLKKKKKSKIFEKKDVIIELNQVEGLGNFLEIECICEKKEETIKARKKVVDVFEKLGFTQNDFEVRTYSELLKIYS